VIFESIHDFRVHIGFSSLLSCCHGFVIEAFETYNLRNLLVFSTIVSFHELESFFLNVF
jgi:hypothetical protein